MDLMIRCDRLPSRGETILVDSWQQNSGGKGANQAVAAALAGGSVEMIGCVGDDAFGSQSIAALNHCNVSTRHVTCLPGSQSGMAVVAVDSSGENSIMVVSGANGQLTAADIRAASDIICRADAMLVQLEIPLDAVIAAIDIAKAAGVPVILDPAPVPASIKKKLFCVDVVCPNQTETETIVGRSIGSMDDARACLAELHRRGATAAIITLGDKGALVSDGPSVEWIEPFSITKMDSTAAGDAFAGALAVSMGGGASLFESARFACAAGAIAATRIGAQTAMPTRNEIETMIGSLGPR